VLVSRLREEAMGLHLVPISEETLKDGIQRWHRHNGNTFLGTILRVGAADDDGVLVAVACAGRPVARHYCDGGTLEVWRVASDGTRNSTSLLYGALARAAFALGYWRIITYTQADESGSSLKAAGWTVVAQRKSRKGWSTPARPRDDARYMTSARTLWENVP
jgi:hypothetical protein